MSTRTITAGLLLSLSLLALLANGDNGTFSLSPHGSQTTGVYRTAEYSRGSCAQCHTAHPTMIGQSFGLFQENSNDLCMGASIGGCHADRPTGATGGYPAQESDRLATGSSDPGYFEYSAGNSRIPGVENHVRWPGRIIWQDFQHSPHNSDPDMPIKDAFGNGACDNCHDVHSGSNGHDMLDTTYRSIVGSQLSLTPDNYLLCFRCHSTDGPIGMTAAGRNILYYYDISYNPGRRAGHGIRTGGGYVPSGARLPCSDCHNPHGSMGYSGQGANNYLISDQRAGWYALNDIKNDNDQVRRFCFGCHRSSDLQGGGQYHDLTLQPLSPGIPEHQFSALVHCYDCHGRDYSSPTSNNVHNPAPGRAGGGIGVGE